MFPSEAAMLMAIAITGDSGKRLLTRPMDVVGEYIGYLYDSLLNRGYLKRDSPREYQLTVKGRETLFEFLYENQGRVKDAIKALQQLGIEINQKVGNLEKKAIKVK